MKVFPAAIREQKHPFSDPLILPLTKLEESKQCRCAEQCNSAEFKKKKPFTLMLK